MTGSVPTPESVLRILDAVMDPEVPVLSVVELGIVREVHVDSGGVTITITPTYSGCPAMRTMEEDMRGALQDHGIDNVAFSTVYAPAWTSDWIGEEAREKLRRFGIAPPGPVGRGPGPSGRRPAETRQATSERSEETEAQPLVHLTLGNRPPVACPYCGSRDTVLRSVFGSTACKAIHYCNACQQPFDEFKAF